MNDLEAEAAFFRELRASGTLRMEMDLRDEIERLRKSLSEILNHPRTIETAEIVRKALDKPCTSKT